MLKYIIYKNNWKLLKANMQQESLFEGVEDSDCEEVQVKKPKSKPKPKTTKPKAMIAKRVKIIIEESDSEDEQEIKWPKLKSEELNREHSSAFFGVYCTDGKLKYQMEHAAYLQLDIETTTKYIKACNPKHPVIQKLTPRMLDKFMWEFNIQPKKHDISDELVVSRKLRTVIANNEAKHKEEMRRYRKRNEPQEFSKQMNEYVNNLIEMKETEEVSNTSNDLLNFKIAKQQIKIETLESENEKLRRQNAELLAMMSKFAKIQAIMNE